MAGTVQTCKDAAISALESPAPAGFFVTDGAAPPNFLNDATTQPCCRYSIILFLWNTPGYWLFIVHDETRITVDE